MKIGVRFEGTTTLEIPDIVMESWGWDAENEEFIDRDHERQVEYNLADYVTEHVAVHGADDFLEVRDWDIIWPENPLDDVQPENGE